MTPAPETDRDRVTAPRSKDHSPMNDRSSTTQGHTNQVIVVGAGVAGLGAALYLSRSGWRVTLIERDATPMPTDPDSAFAWDRRGAPQVRHSHALLGRIHNLIRDDHPDVLRDLLGEGATEIRFTDLMPPTLDDPTPAPGDEDLVMLACRRTTFEWVLRRTVAREGRVGIRTGSGVAALTLGPRSDGLPPPVTGVVLEDGTELGAEVVVVANGRRSELPEWLRRVGLPPGSEETEDTGIVYHSRFYRLNPGREFPTSDRPIAGDLTYLKYGVFWGDNRTFSLTLAVPQDDRTLRALRDPEVFDAAASLLPAPAEWIDGRAIPITGVHSMAGLINRRRRFVHDGMPVALGLHAIGDATLCTNPLYGRGCSLGFWQARLLADALAGNPDPVGAARALEEATRKNLDPWYEASVQSDRAARAALERQVDPRDGTEDDPALFMRSVIREGLQPASRTHAVVWRSFIRLLNLLSTPDALMAPEVAGPILTAWQERTERDPDTALGPERGDFLASLGLTSTD